MGSADHIFDKAFVGPARIVLVFIEQTEGDDGATGVADGACHGCFSLRRLLRGQIGLLSYRP